MTTFTCAGCERKIRIKKNDPKTQPSIWRDAATDKPRQYCDECDLALIQDVALPRKPPGPARTSGITGDRGAYQRRYHQIAQIEAQLATEGFAVLTPRAEADAIWLREHFAKTHKVSGVGRRVIVGK